MIKKVDNRDTLVISKAGIDKLKSNTVKMDNQVDSRVDNLIDNEVITLLTKNIDLLQEQLKIKDSQIIELNERLKEQQDLSKNNQILLLREQQKNTVQELESLEQKESRTLLDKVKNFFKS